MHSSYDEARAKIDAIDDEFKSHLEEVKELLGCSSIEYVHSKYRYELEIPESKASRIPKDF